MIPDQLLSAPTGSSGVGQDRSFCFRTPLNSTPNAFRETALSRPQQPWPRLSLSRNCSSGNDVNPIPIKQNQPKKNSDRVFRFTELISRSRRRVVSHTLLLFIRVFVPILAAWTPVAVFFSLNEISLAFLSLFFQATVNRLTILGSPV